MKKTYLLFIPLGLFFLIKISHLSVRLSDTNVYFYTAYELVQGKLLYKDIFFTNLPLFPYISMLYFFLSFKRLDLYFFTAVMETLFISGTLFVIVKQQTKMLFLPILTSTLYLFSFIVLSTSDHQTGVFTASLLGVLAYLLILKKRYIFSAILVSLMLLTKAYFLPVYVSFLVFMFIKKRDQFILFLLSSFGSIILVMLPTLILSRDAFIAQVIHYSLSRTDGVSKSNIVWFFIKHDFFLFTLYLYSIISIRKNILFGTISILCTAFFLYYQVPYYLYLNFFIAFLCLSLPAFLTDVDKMTGIQKMVIPSIIFSFCATNLIVYLNGYVNLGNIQNLPGVLQTIQSHHPSFLYGVDDTTPALAYISHAPLLSGIVDTNPNLYRKHILNASTLTETAIKKHALLISHGIYYPEQGINMPLISEVIDKKLAGTYCKLVGNYTVHTEGVENQITLFSCK